MPHASRLTRPILAVTDLLRETFDLQSWVDAAWTYAAPRLPPSLGLIATGLVLWLLAHALLHRFARRLAARTENRFDDEMVVVLRACAMISIAFWLAWRLASLWLPTAAGRVVVGVWIVALAIPISRFLITVLLTVSRRAVPSSSAFDRTATPWVRRLVAIATIGAAVMIALDYLGISVAPLLAGAGVAGLALSLAAKDTLSNLIAGILLVIDRPFVVGDRIELWRSPENSASWGDVVEIGLRATKIRNTDNVIVVIPNDEIMRRDIINYTATGQTIRLRLPIPIAYDADPKLAKELILGVAASTPGVLAEPAPVVLTRNFGNSSVDLELRIWLEDARARRAVADEITDRVKDAFDAKGIEIPYPKRDIRIRSLPEAGGAASDVDADAVTETTRRAARDHSASSTLR